LISDEFTTLAVWTTGIFEGDWVMTVGALCERVFFLESTKAARSARRKPDRAQPQEKTAPTAEKPIQKRSPARVLRQRLSGVIFSKGLAFEILR
jgi:hypothetical protein